MHHLTREAFLFLHTYGSPHQEPTKLVVMHQCQSDKSHDTTASLARHMLSNDNVFWKVVKHIKGNSNVTTLAATEGGVSGAAICEMY